MELLLLEENLWVEALTFSFIVGLLTLEVDPILEKGLLLKKGSESSAKGSVIPTVSNGLPIPIPSCFDL